MSRRFARATLWLLVLFHAASAMADAIDTDRLNAAEKRAEKRWLEAGYDQMHPFDSERLAAVAGDATDGRVIDVIAQVLSRENPTKSGAVLAYLNETLIPFITANRERYLCIKTEDYYNVAVPTREIESVQEYGETWIFDLGFWLIQTEAPRHRAQLALPESYRAALDPLKSFVKQNGWTMRGNTVRLDCAHSLSQRSNSPQEGIDG